MKIFPSGTLISERYEVAGRPLMGGMGMVYICFDHQEQHPVALKTFRLEYLPNRAARDRFLREGTTWLNLGKHPNIVQCYGVERVGDGREVYLVLELVAKEQGMPDASLRSWLIPGRPLPIEKALLFGIQIVRAMKHATETIPGFVHHDLKPENILVGADRYPGTVSNRLRVTDFGLANGLYEGSQPPAVSGKQEYDPIRLIERTQLTHGIVGTPLYIAPEVWQVGEVGMWTDVYAFGCILYEMLVGKTAVNGDSMGALKQAHCEGRIGPLPDGLPQIASEMVTRCLAFEPRERYPSWAETETAIIKISPYLTGQSLAISDEHQELFSVERIAQGWSHNAIGISYLDISKYDLAVEHFKKAVEVGKEENEYWLEGAALNGLGLASRNTGNLALAVQQIEDALQIAQNIGDKRCIGAALGNLGTCYRLLGRLKDALAYHKHRLAIAYEVGDRSSIGTALSNLGMFHQETGQLHNAIQYHQKHLDIAHEVDDLFSKAGALNSLGICHFIMGETDKAIAYYKNASNISCQIGDLRGQGRALAGLGQCYLKSNPQDAIQHLKKAHDISREINDRQGLAGSLGALAMYHYLQKEYDEAELFWRKSLTVSDEIGNVRTSAGTRLMLAVLMEQQGRLSEALPFASHAVKTFENIGPAIYVEQAQKLLARIQKRLN